MAWKGDAPKLAIGCGLMALMFYSSRHGYDEPTEHKPLITRSGQLALPGSLFRLLLLFLLPGGLGHFRISHVPEFFLACPPKLSLLLHEIGL